MKKLALIFLSAVAVFSSCKKIDLDAQGANPDSPDTEELLPVLGVGLGTSLYPYTVADVLDGSALQGEAWVIGYAVGATRQSLSNAEFSADAASNTCILLSMDSLATDIDSCIPAQLEKANVRALFSLPSDPSRFRQCVLIHGVIGQYMRKNGLRSVDEGRWMLGFDISSLTSCDEE